jgi:hypothetical protein
MGRGGERRVSCECACTGGGDGGERFGRGGRRLGASEAKEGGGGKGYREMIIKLRDDEGERC